MKVEDTYTASRHRGIVKPLCLPIIPTLPVCFGAKKDPLADILRVILIRQLANMIGALLNG